MRRLSSDDVLGWLFFVATDRVVAVVVAVTVLLAVAGIVLAVLA